MNAPERTGPSPTWSPVPPHLELAADTVDVWRATAPVTGNARETLLAILNAEERARAERYLMDEPRETFIVGRAILRTALAQYLDTTPASIELVTGEHGRPLLADRHSDANLSFNVSHSAGRIVLAFTRQRALGIDIESRRDDIEMERLAQRYFAPGETERLLALPPDQRPAAFLRCWTRKEAYLKAHGAGLTFPLDRFEVTLGPDEAPALLWTEIQGDTPDDWVLQDLVTHPDCQTALIVRGPPGPIRTWEAL